MSNEIKEISINDENYPKPLKEIKDRILEYLSVMKLNIEEAQKNPGIGNHNFMRAPIHHYSDFANWDSRYQILKRVQKYVSNILGREVKVYS